MGEAEKEAKCEKRSVVGCEESGEKSVVGVIGEERGGRGRR